LRLIVELLNFGQITLFEAFLKHFTNQKSQRIMAKFDEIKNLVMGLEGDFDKFYNKGNQAAGTRVRKGMQDLKNLAQAIRAEVQNSKNEKE
jgi:Histone H1-like protein Hc1